MNDWQPPLFLPAIFAKVFTVVLAVAVAGIAGVIWYRGTIAARDVAGTLISAAIFAYWLHLLIISRQDFPVNRE